MSLVIEEGVNYLESGTYILDQGLPITTKSRIVGESRHTTIIKANYSDAFDSLLKPEQTLEVENITFDGNSLPTNGITPNTNVHPEKVLRVKNCRFTNINGFDIFLGVNQYGVDVSDCIFDNHQNNNDQFALECTGYANVYNNLFDRTQGVTDGEQLTSGSAKNCNIHDNIFRGVNVNSISMEGFNDHQNYDNLSIHDNLLYNGVIVVGSVGDWSETYRNISVSNNLLFHGGIGVRGPSSGDYANLIRDVTVENNTLIDSWQSGIFALNIDGYTTIRNNTIKNSNTSLDPIEFDKGAIYLERVTDVVCENNNIYMGKGTSNDFSPFGIKYVTMKNPTIVKNTILNRTSNNPSYISQGNHAGKILIVK